MENDLISRSAVMDAVLERMTIGKRVDGVPVIRETITARELNKLINDVPAVDAVPVVHENWLNNLRDEIHMDAVKHGLWTDTDGPMRCASLIGHEVEELSEAAGNVLDVRCDGGDETEVWSDYCEELADVVIMCFSVAGKLGIDIDAAVRRKMEINKSRPWKHGKE